MSGDKVVNELENVIIFCIATVLLSFFFYYLLDFSSHQQEGFTANIGLIFKRLIMFVSGGTIAALIKFFARKTWDFRLFFWVNVLLIVIVLIIDINLILFA